MSKNELNEEVTAGVDYSHTLYVERLRHNISSALSELRGVDLKCLNHAGQYSAIERIERAMAALCREPQPR